MPRNTVYDDAATKLWEASKTDWHIGLGLTITEPVCAIVELSSDEDHLPKLDGFIGNGDANDSIRLACEYMLRNLEAFYSENPDKRPSP